MRLLGICALLVVTGCERPALTDAHRDEVADIASDSTADPDAVSSRFDDLDTRIQTIEAKNLELETETSRLNAEIEALRSEVRSLEARIPY